MKLNIVPARTGIQWVKLGIRTFIRQPLALVTLFFMYTAIVFMLSAIPVIGPGLGAVLIPGITLGMMAAAKEASEGRFPMPTILLSAFRAGRQRLRAMLLLGAIYCAGVLLIVLIANMFVSFPTPEAAETPAGQAAFARYYFIMLLLHMPLAVLFWHAPALVHWHGVSPVKSLFFSAVAWIRNFRAFAVYLVAWIVVFVAVGQVFALIGLALGGAALAQAVLVPPILLLVAMATTSTYFTFRDSFVATSDAEQQPPGDPQ